MKKVWSFAEAGLHVASETQRNAMLMKFGSYSAAAAIILMTSAWSAPVLAQALVDGGSATPPADESLEAPVEQLSVSINAWMLQPVVDDFGAPKTHDDGSAVFEEISMEGRTVTPGDQIVYRLNIEGGTELSTDVSVNLPIPHALELVGMSISSDLPATFSVSDVTNDMFVPVFAPYSHQELSEEFHQAHAKGLDALVAKIDEIPAETRGSVSYRMVVR